MKEKEITIRIKQSTRDKLIKYGKFGQTYDDVIRSILQQLTQKAQASRPHRKTKDTRRKPKKKISELVNGFDDGR